MAIYPRSWEKYVARHEVDDFPKGVGTFLARYSMAKAYRTSTFQGMHTNSERNYSLLIRAGLAYSAVESIEKLISDGKRIYLELEDIDLVSSFRDTGAHKLLEAVTLNAESKTLRTNLEQFRVGQHNDLHSIAASIRHLTFHGAGNPHKLGLDRSLFIRTCIDDLADLQLDQATNEFSKYIEMI